MCQVTYGKCKEVTMNATLGKLSRILDTEHFVSVVHEQKTYKTTSEVTMVSVIGNKKREISRDDIRFIWVHIAALLMRVVGHLSPYGV